MNTESCINWLELPLQQRKRPVAQQQEPAAGPSGNQGQNNRIFVRAQRRLVPNNGNTRGFLQRQQRQNQRDNSPDARTMAQAMKIAKILGQN